MRCLSASLLFLTTFGTNNAFRCHFSGVSLHSVNRHPQSFKHIEQATRLMMENEDFESAEKFDAGIVAAAGVTSACFGWALMHSFNEDLELYGAMVGGVFALYVSSLGGKTGEVPRFIGKVTLFTVKILQSLFAKSKVGEKVIGAVGNELVDVIELTSAAVSKGVQSNKSSPTQIEKELEDTQIKLSKTRAELKDARNSADAALFELSSMSRTLKDAGLAPEAIKAEVSDSTLQNERIQILEAALTQANNKITELTAALIQANNKITELTEMLSSQAAGEDYIFETDDSSIPGQFFMQTLSASRESGIESGNSMADAMATMFQSSLPVISLDDNKQDELKSFSEKNLSELTVKELRNLCKGKKLSTTGKKQELIDRLESK